MLMLMITVVLCIVILCMRRSHRKKGSHIFDNATNKLNTNVTIYIDHNPSYDVTIDHNLSYDVTIDDHSHGIRGVHSHPTANTPTEDENVIYGVVNQPRS